MVRARLQENTKNLAEAENLLQVAATDYENYLKKYPDIPLPEQTPLLAPLEAAVDEQIALVTELDLEIKSLVLRAPIDGTICQIFYRPGDYVQEGEPIVMIAADEGRYAVSYVRQNQYIQPRKSMLVDVRKRIPGSQPREVFVEEVGPQFELIPVQLLRDPTWPEWGLPVRIALPDRGFDVRPGELIDVRFRSWSRGKAG